MTPHQAAQFMKKRGNVDQDFINAYLEEEAKRAGCTVEDFTPLSLAEQLRRSFEKLKAAMLAPPRQSDYWKGA